jgi:SCY1-like protein 1
MLASYRKLVNTNPKARASVSNFLEQGRRNGGFFETPLIKLTDSMDNLGMKSEEEREEFLK